LDTDFLIPSPQRYAITFNWGTGSIAVDGVGRRLLAISRIEGLSRRRKIGTGARETV
jgi:hypothetical protein